MTDAESQRRPSTEMRFDDLRTELNKDLADLKPPLAYHYTTTRAVQSILTTGKVWATEVAFLNDPSEWAHGHELFARDVESRCRPDAAAATRLPLESLAAHIRKRIKRKFLVMVASFCEDPDDLALWRPYAADGAGCCIGVDLAKVPDDGPGGASTTRMIYEETAKQHRTRESVTAHMRLADELSSHTDGRELFEHVTWSLQIQASLLATTFKHRAYRAEVVVGPRHPLETIVAWQSWLRSVGAEHIKVRPSEAPYRMA